MLSLNQTLSLPGLKHIGFLPSNISNLDLWLRENYKMTADEDSSDDPLSPVHSTDAGTMEDGDRINFWGDQSGNANNAVQTTTADKPSWSTDQLGSINNAAGNFLDLTSTLTINANTNFSIVFRVNFGATNARAFMGNDSSNFFRLNDASTFRVRIGSAASNNFTEASDTISTGTFYTVILSRSNGATGDLRLYVDGGSYSDKTWGSTTNTDNDAFTITNICAAADDTNTMNGFVSDVLIYNGTVLTTAQRSTIYNYLS